MPMPKQSKSSLLLKASSLCLAFALSVLILLSAAHKSFHYLESSPLHQEESSGSQQSDCALCYWSKSFNFVFSHNTELKIILVFAVVFIYIAAKTVFAPDFKIQSYNSRAPPLVS